MTRITIVTKLRFAAVIAPIILLIATLFVAYGFHLFGALPAALHDNQYQASDAANSMEAALYKMDWGRAQPDGAEIVRDQQREFAGAVDTARAHASTQAQLDAIEKIAETANPIFDAMRASSSGGDNFEPQMRDLQGKVADLVTADDSAVMAVAARAQARASIFVIVAIVTGIVVPWLCFIAITQMGTRVRLAMLEIRHRIENLRPEDAPMPEDLRVIDDKLNELGFHKPNPMLAE